MSGFLPKYSRTLDDGWYWLDDARYGGWRIIHVENGAVKYHGTAIESRFDDAKLNSLDRIKISLPVNNDSECRWF